jgi:hypothetical protein
VADSLTLKRSPDVLDELLADGSMVLFNTRSRTLMTLNPAAALVWESCDGERAEAASVSEVQAVFPQAEAVSDSVLCALRDLRAREMLRPAVSEP